MPDLHAHDADVIIERFAFGKLADFIDNATKEFLGRQRGMTIHRLLKLLLGE